MNVLSCIPNCAPFADPSPEEENIVSGMVERAESEKTRALKPSDYECKKCHLLRILRSNNHDVEVAMKIWNEWVTWRHEKKIDDISDDDIKHEIDSELAVWRGKDKMNRPCCIITGRHYHPETTRGTYASYRKFLIRTVEQGIDLADEANEEEVCIIYDRRGLTFSNIDPNLFQATRSLIEELKRWYSGRLGTVYVLHVNWFYWMLYAFFIRPFMSFLPVGNRLFVVARHEHLLEVFHEEQLHLFSMDHRTPADIARDQEENDSLNPQPEPAVAEGKQDAISPDNDTIIR